MNDSVDQIEKHTIFARLSVSIYKMDDTQLEALLHLFENGSGKSGSAGLHQLTEESDSVMRRQMIIARLFVLINAMDKDTLLNQLLLFENPEFRWVREYPRLSCYIMVDFAAGGKAYRSCIRDISAGGVFIETKDTFKEGQQIALCFTLAESNETLPFKVNGRVRRVYPDGIGVQYEKMSHYQREIISALVGKP